MVFRRAPVDVTQGLKADGSIMGYPYRCDLAGKDGMHLHVWTGTRSLDRQELAKVLSAARNTNDIVSASHSLGRPAGFYEPRQNIAEVA